MAIILGACSSNKTEQDIQNVLEEQAINFAISEGEKHYAEKVKNHQAYKSFEKPEVVSIEVLENTYYDVRCRTKVVYTGGGKATVEDVYYELRLEYDKADNDFSVLKQNWGGF